MTGGPDAPVWRAWRALERFVNRSVAPNPPAGQVWCVGCARNGGRTLAMPYADLHLHAGAVHGPGEIVSLISGDLRGAL